MTNWQLSCIAIPSLVTKVEQFRRYRLNKARHTDRQRGGQMDMAIPSYLPNFGMGVYKNKVYKLWEVTFWQPDYFSQSMGMQDSKLISCHLLSFLHAFSSHNVHFVLFLLLLFLYTSAWNYPLNMHFPHKIHTLRCNNEIIFFFLNDYTKKIEKSLHKAWAKEGAQKWQKKGEREGENVSEGGGRKGERYRQRYT